MGTNSNKLALYASFQTGDTLPGYVRYALEKLAATDFQVVLITNERELSKETKDFLKDNGIQLFLTENHGFDFGMWRRYLQQQVRENRYLNNLERLLLINDSIVYYDDLFPRVFAQAENSAADVISLTENDEVMPHLQSFFLYMKQPALGAFFVHIMETPEQETFYDVVHKLEIGMAKAFEEAEVTTQALYPTEAPIMFSYPELIAKKAGFIKRKLLQGRFDFSEKVHFIRKGGYDALNADYCKLISQAGVAKDFQLEWLPTPVNGIVKRTLGKAWQKPFQKVGWPVLRTLIKIKYKILRRELKGDEYK